MLILNNLIRTIFLDLLALTGGIGAISIVSSVLQSFIDSMESRKRIMRVLSNITLAMCSAMLLVVVIQIIKPIVNPSKYIKMLTNPAFYLK